MDKEFIVHWKAVARQILFAIIRMLADKTPLRMDAFSRSRLNPPSVPSQLPNVPGTLVHVTKIPQTLRPATNEAQLTTVHFNLTISLIQLPRKWPQYWLTRTNPNSGAGEEAGRFTVGPDNHVYLWIRPFQEHCPLKSTLTTPSSLGITVSRSAQNSSIPSNNLAWKSNGHHVWKLQ